MNLIRHAINLLIMEFEIDITLSNKQKYSYKFTEIKIINANVM